MDLHPPLGGGDAKVYLVDKPNLACNIGLLCMLGLTISLPALMYYPIMQLQYLEYGTSLVIGGTFLYLCASYFGLISVNILIIEEKLLY